MALIIIGFIPEHIYSYLLLDCKINTYNTLKIFSIKSK